MARYVDVDKVIEVIVNTPSMVGSKYDFDHDVLTALVDKEHEIIDLINNNAPSEDVAPVVHAHWTYEIDDLFPADSMMICSNCGYESLAYENDVHTDEDCNYCPCCGAKMDEAEIIGKRLIDGFIDGIGDNAKSVGQKFINNDKDTVEHTIMGMKNEVTHETG